MNELQLSLHKLNKLITKCGMTISMEEDLKRRMVFCSHKPKIGKITISNKIIQVNTFNYLGCSLSYEEHKDTEDVSANIIKITGFLNTIFKPSEVYEHSGLTNYNGLPLPTLLYRSENWIWWTKGKAKITAAEIRFMRQMVKYGWMDDKGN
jgi:hypothetical protein